MVSNPAIGPATGEAIEDQYRLSPVQEGMLFHHLSGTHSGVDVEQIVIDLPESIDRYALEAAWRRVIERHAVLRTSFEWEHEPVQLVHRVVPFSLNYESWRDLSSDQRESKTEEYLRAERRRGFDLRQPPLMRVLLLELGDARFRLMWTFHHILVDGRAFSIILREVFGLHQDPSIELPPTQPYRSYIDWLQSIDLSHAREFWHDKLAGFIAPTPLYNDLASRDQAVPADRYGEVEMRLSQPVSDRLKQFAVEQNVTLNTVLMTAWGLLLARYSGEEDVVFAATKTARRSGLPGADKIVGLFLNTIPIRMKLASTTTVSEVLRNLRQEWVSLREYEHSPLVLIKEASDVPPSAPLFDSLVVFENQRFDAGLKSMGDLWSKRSFRLLEQTNFTLSFLAYGDTEILLKIEYDSTRYTRGAIALMLRHLELLLDGMVSNPDAPALSLPMLTAEERQHCLVDWNQTGKQYPAQKSVSALLDLQAKSAPERVAVITEEGQLTYAEMHSRANRLARYLQSLGVGPESLVGISLERSYNMLVALLAVMKSGGAYVPLDPSFPVDRLAYIAADAGLQIVITQQSLLERSQSLAPTKVVIDSAWEEIANHSDAAMECSATPENLVYILYTSGSTGKPKGVEITHAAVLNFLHTMREVPGIAADDTLLAVTTISFDIAGLELYLPLMVGASIVLASRDAALNGLELMRLMEQHRVTMMQATPATWQMLLDSGWTGKADLKILCGGEALPKELAARLLSLGRELWNVYGPTETTIWSLVERITDTSGPILIGRPIANTDVFILDKAGQPVPVGVSEELLIGGDGVARGYHNRPDLTAEKFVPNPFSNRPGARLYKTGDLARYYPDGRIECLGRVDFQVKVRGFRIELGEIESVLAQRPDVAHNVVIVREDTPGDKRIVGYVIPAAGAAFDAGVARQHLREVLPDYMVPSDFVVMDAFPLTPNKKVDRRALPAPAYDPSIRDTDYVPPRNPVEESLCQIWAELLGVPRVGIHDNFFDLGGHSLLAVRLLARVLERWPYQQLTIAVFLQAPTVAELAAILQSCKRVSNAYLVAYRKSGTRPPFFCLPGAGGNVVSLRSLAAAMSADQPLYCLQAKGLDGTEPFNTVEEAAAFSIEQIRQVQMHGPYYLGGACFGGLIAFEMAQMLRKQGEEVGLLALIDTYNFAYGRTLSKPRSLWENMQFMGRRVGHHLRRMQDVPWNERASYLSARMNAVRRYLSDLLAVARGDARNQLPVDGIPVQLGEDAGIMQEALNRVTAASLNAAATYVPQYYDGSILLFKASDRVVEPYRESALGWGPFAADIEINEVEANHLTITGIPRVAAITRCIEAAIEENVRRTSVAAPQTTTSV
jgi:amino acid adenylation domain-containing protein